MRAFTLGKLFSTLTVMLVALSSLTIFEGASQAVAPSSEVGHFSFSYDNGTCLIQNISFTNANYSMIVASSASASGKSVPAADIGYKDISNSVDLANVTIASTLSEDMLLLATTGVASGSNPQVTLNLQSPTEQVELTAQQKHSLKSSGDCIMNEFVSNPVYRIAVTDGYIYYVSNSPSTLSNGGHSIVFQNSSFVQGNTMVVGITPSASIKYSLYKQINSTSLGIDPFIYDSSTGKATGSYVSLNFDSSTGVISDFTSLYTGTNIFNSISSSGNGAMGGSPVDPAFPTNDPLVIGNVLYYANHTVSYEFQNSISTMTQFYLNNGTTRMKVDNSLNITVMNIAQRGMGHAQRSGEVFSDSTNFGHGKQYTIQAAPTILVISSSSYTGQLFVHDGDVTVAGNTISISSTGTAYASFVSQPWFMGIAKGVRDQLQYGMQQGTVGAVVSLGDMDPTMSNLTTLYNANLQLEVQVANQNMVKIQLGSSSTSGTSVALYIPNDIIRNTSSMNIDFDGQQIGNVPILNGVLNATSQNEPAYYIAPVAGGSLLVVSVPHFSSHVVSISADLPAVGGSILEYVAIMALVWIFAIVSILVYRRTRGK